MSGSGREVLPDIREWSGGPPGCPGLLGSSYRFRYDSTEFPGVVGRPSRMSESGREALPDVREWSGDSSWCSRVVGRLSWRSGSGRW